MTGPTGAGHGAGAGTSPPPRPFTDAEFAARLGQVQTVMAERSLAALVVADPANLYYLTGYNAWSFYTPQCLVVPATGLPHLFARAMDAQGGHHTAYLGHSHIHGYPEDLVHRPDVHPFEWIADRALELGLIEDASGVDVAAETDAHFFSARGFLALRSRLRQAALVDSRELVNWVRVIKSPAEQEKMRIAGAIAERVMATALDAVTPGRRQCDVAAEIQHTQARGTPTQGGDYPAVVPMLPTGETAGTPHLTWSDRQFVRGEATTIELAGVHHRYHAPLARTVSLGKPPRRLVSCADAVTEGMEAALEALRPGSTGHDVHAAFTRVISRRGLTKDSRIGYSVGIGYPPDWGERTVSLRAEDGTEISAGMAFHVILGMWMDGWGYETSEPVLVTERGAEQLAHLPRGLTVKH
jgi:ectoine hydrolase